MRADVSHDPGVAVSNYGGRAHSANLWDSFKNVTMETLRSKARRATSHPGYQFAFTAIAGAVVGIVVAGGVRIYGTASDDAVGIASSQPARMVVVEPAKRADAAKAKAPSHGPARAPQITVIQGTATSAVAGKSGREAAQGPSAPEAAGDATGLSAPSINPTGLKAATGDPGRDREAEPSEWPQSTEQKTAAMSQDEICKRDAAQLAHLRISQAPDEVIRFERELGCVKLRPQVIRLRESVDPQ